MTIYERALAPVRSGDIVGFSLIAEKQRKNP
jgi:hypothetical protein